MELRAYIVRRLLLLIPVMFGVSLLIFGVVQLFSPLQRATLYIKDPKQLAHLGEVVDKYGLNDPFWQQYGTWLSQLFHGNLGWCKIVAAPVGEAILKFLPTTVELAIFATPLIILGGIFLGSKAAANKDKVIDHASRVGAIIGWSLPTFWLGLMLLMIFYGYFSGLFPPGRLSTDVSLLVNSDAFHQYTHIHTIDAILNGNFRVLVDALRHLVLPVVTLTVVNLAFIMRLMRSSMLESLGKGYVLTARAKGLDEKTVINKHARRNALIPVLTVSGYLFAAIISGVVITETIFNFRGVGWLAWQSAVQLDIPTVLGFALFTATVFVLANLVVDLLYARIDPRVRLGGRAK